MASKATTIAEYLDELPEDRRAAISAVRKVVLDNLPAGYEEIMQYGMIGYVVPHSLFPPGYHCDPKQPLTYASLGNQKNYMAIYLMGVYGDGPLAEWFRTAYLATGKRLDMGKSCVRFKRLEDLPLDVIGQTIARVTPQAYIDHYQALRAKQTSKK